MYRFGSLEFWWVCLDMVWIGVFGVVGFGLVWFDWVRLVLVLFVRSGSIQSGSHGFGLVWISSVWLGLV